MKAGSGREQISVRFDSARNGLTQPIPGGRSRLCVIIVFTLFSFEKGTHATLVVSKPTPLGRTFAWSPGVAEIKESGMWQLEAGLRLMLMILTRASGQQIAAGSDDSSFGQTSALASSRREQIRRWQFVPNHPIRMATRGTRNQAYHFPT